MATSAPIMPASGTVLYLAPGDLDPSINPRRKPVPKDRFEEMVDSVKKHGVLQPLLVRPDSNGRHQVVLGDTRRRAAIEAKAPTVPCISRVLADLEALELQLVENIQRHDMHPLDEGAAFVKLMKEDPKAYTAETIASRVGKSVRWVYQRIEFTKLILEAGRAFLNDEITASHAERLVRLNPKDQKRALEGCFDQVLHGPEGAKVLRSTAELDDWIARHCRLNLESPAVSELLPDVGDAKREAEAEGAKLLQLSSSYAKPPKGVLGPNDYKIATGQQRCKLSVRGVLVIGQGQGDLREVCINRTCEKHWPSEKPTPQAAQTPAQRRAQERQTKEAQKWQREQQARRQRETAAQELAARAGPAIREKVRLLKTIPPALVAIALRQLIGRNFFPAVQRVVKHPAKDPGRACVMAVFVATPQPSYVYDLAVTKAVLKALKIDLKKLAAEGEKTDGAK